MALLGDQDQQAVGGADGEQVHGDAGCRHDDRAEGQRQQDEAEAEHQCEHDRQVLVGDVEVVQVLGACPGHVGLQLGAGHGAGEVAIAQVADGVQRRVGVGVAGHRDGDYGQALGRRDRGCDRSEAVVLGEFGAELAERLAGGGSCHVAVDDDGGRGDLADGEVAVEDDVSLLSKRAVRQGGEAGRARVDIEVGDRADQQQRDRGHDGDDAVAHDQIDRAPPESLMRRGRFLGAAAEERHPQRFHTIAE